MICLVRSIFLPNDFSQYEQAWRFPYADPVVFLEVPTGIGEVEYNIAICSGVSKSCQAFEEPEKEPHFSNVVFNYRIRPF